MAASLEIPVDLETALAERYTLRRVLGRSWTSAATCTVWRSWSTRCWSARFRAAGALDLAPLLGVIVPAWLATTYLTARTVYRRSTKKRARELEDLADRLAALARELIPLPPRLRP